MELDLTVNGFPTKVYYSDGTRDRVLLPLVGRFRTLREEAGQRVIIFLAAPPGAGKSTLGKTLEYLAGGDLQCLSIDGFHRRNAELAKMVIERPDGPKRGSEIKGAPETYDVDKLKANLAELKTSGSQPVRFPFYDRNLHEPAEDAEAVTAPILLLEGNWLLYRGCGWEELKDYADLTVFLDAEEADVREGLTRRKMRGGLTREEAEAWFEASDGPNVRAVRSGSAPADILLKRTAQGEIVWQKG